jgi:putative flavoprotein involved in K+ transport
LKILVTRRDRRVGVWPSFPENDLFFTWRSMGTDTMADRWDVVVIGGGQAGLATSYCLSAAERDCDHVVFERGRVGERWRSESWESFTMVTQNWGNRLPGFSYRDCDQIPDDPDAFLTADQVVAFLDAYADHFDAPLRTGVEVTSLRKDGSTFTVGTSDGTHEAANVVVATGGAQEPSIPAFSGGLPPSVEQLHTSGYRRPDELPPGAVLVVGSGQSGGQIATELHRSGRQVFLSVGGSGKMPRRYRGKDIIRWLDAMGRDTVEDLDSPALRFTSNALFSGYDGGEEIDLLDLREDGMTLLGRAAGVDDGTLRFADDLAANLRSAYAFYNGRLDAIDEYIATEGIEAPPADRERVDLESISAESPRQLDLGEAGIEAVIWATGLDLDFSCLPGEGDSQGYPVHGRGVTSTPGL